MLGATLTMPGIAGLVLGLGMAVDANVLIFERIREELRTARGPARAIDLGFEKAFSPILDGNVTTLIVGGHPLLRWARGRCRASRITLALGLLCSMFTAISLSRLIIAMWYELAASEDGRGLRETGHALPDGLRRSPTSTSSSRSMRFWLAVSILGVVLIDRAPADPRAELRRRLPRRHA